jgi:hypothetical protein
MTLPQVRGRVAVLRDVLQHRQHVGVAVLRALWAQHLQHVGGLAPSMGRLPLPVPGLERGRAEGSTRTLTLPGTPGHHTPRGSITAKVCRWVGMA